MEQVWSKISAGLGNVKVLLAGDAEAYGYLKTFIRKLYGPICSSIGWEKREGEASTTSTDCHAANLLLTVADTKQSILPCLTLPNLLVSWLRQPVPGPHRLAEAFAGAQGHFGSR